MDFAFARTKAMQEQCQRQTEQNPQHDCCPVGPSSWCSYQRDLACKTKSHRYIKDPLPLVVVNVIKPVFDKLGDESFLGGCERCATQNANESLHHVIWVFPPKDQFTSQIENSRSVNLGVLIFNGGMEVTYSQLLPKIGVEVTSSMKRAWREIDRKRIYGGDYKERDEVKERRKRYKRKKAKKLMHFFTRKGYNTSHAKQKELEKLDRRHTKERNNCFTLCDYVSPVDNNLNW